ncbi:MAG: hypothetical protein QOI41_6263 [Myxococcales bacterium]|nr:hypothetical protein [Myxococcales bacterium]
MLSTRPRSFGFVLLATLALPFAAGCAPADGKSAAHAHGSGTDPRVRAAKLQRIRQWEASQLKMFHVELPDGLMSADVEAKAPPKVECKNLEDGTRSCGIVLDIGKDDEGDPRTVECSATWNAIPLPFGVMVRTALGKFGLDEPPRVNVAWAAGRDGGLVARFNAHVSYETPENTIVGTAKFAVRYTPGHTLFCTDTTGGAEATMLRLTSELFDSAKVKGNADGVVIQDATKERRGDAATGFRFSFIKKAEDGGFTEVSSSFHVMSTDERWDVRDSLRSASRDEKGAIESLRQVYWMNPKNVFVLSAKPGEQGRVRIKLEANGKSDALEVTPRAPLSTEIWESPGLLRVGSGGSTQHRYAFLAVSDEGEPTLAYSNLTRIRDGLVQEEVEVHGKKSKNADKHEKNELSLDARGFVVKQVSSDSVDERLYLSGALPLSPSGSPQAAAPTATAGKSAESRSAKLPKGKKP